MHLAQHGTNATVDQLKQKGAIRFSGRSCRGYGFVDEVHEGLGFRIVARPVDRSGGGWPTFSISQVFLILGV